MKVYLSYLSIFHSETQQSCGTFGGETVKQICPNRRLQSETSVYISSYNLLFMCALFTINAY